jgi:hypothetical protein
VERLKSANQAFHPVEAASRAVRNISQIKGTYCERFVKKRRIDKKLIIWLFDVSPTKRNRLSSAHQWLVSFVSFF